MELSSYFAWEERELMVGKNKDKRRKKGWEEDKDQRKLRGKI